LQYRKPVLNNPITYQSIFNHSFRLTSILDCSKQQLKMIIDDVNNFLNGFSSR